MVLALRSKFPFCFKLSLTCLHSRYYNWETPISSTHPQAFYIQVAYRCDPLRKQFLEVYFYKRFLRGRNVGENPTLNTII
jgi:hypothetical protein